MAQQAGRQAGEREPGGRPAGATCQVLQAPTPFLRRLLCARPAHLQQLHRRTNPSPSDPAPGRRSLATAAGRSSAKWESSALAAPTRPFLAARRGSQACRGLTRLLTKPLAASLSSRSRPPSACRSAQPALMRSCKPWARSKVKQGHGRVAAAAAHEGAASACRSPHTRLACMRPCGPAPTCCAHSSAESKRIAIDIRHVSAHVPLMVPAHKQQGGGVAAALKRLLPSPAALGRRIASQASLLKGGSSNAKMPGSHRQVGRLASGWAMPAASSAQHLLTHRSRSVSCTTRSVSICPCSTVPLTSLLPA